VPAAGTETILVAEDEQIVRVLIRKVLEQAGYTVLVAGGGAEALQVAARHTGRIHLLVSDVVMPGMSGRELARRLLEARPDTKVLYLSGYADDAVERHGVLDPGTAFMQKPFSPSALALRVRDVLGGG
jgi:CheY-like chemotaxis protein